MKNVTIKDVAKAAGVSYSTVSRALSGSPEISADTRERILQVCKDMNYTANTVARAMVMKSTKLLGLILTGVNNPFMSELAYHIDRQARARGYNIILCNSSRDAEQERELFELMIGRQVDGIILCPSGPESYESLRPYLSRLPTVFVGENLREVPESYVAVDNARGAYIGVEYLYNLGHRDILYFGRRRGSVTHQLRADGYAAACRDLGLTPQYCNNTFSFTSIKYGYQLAKQLFAQERHYSAIFAATDTNALGIMQAAEENGIRIPEDISLLGFDNIRDSGLPRINLTTIEQQKKMLASVAVDSLLDKIQNELAGYTHRILTPTLIERSSCAPYSGK
ncbi:LacI family DNA-binding transcriptional regulator [Dysosmobacter sp.]|uniref:LacI family DNA-binding transcriptional regulator n=1 Tax=Dysosmobacter sp. TaxID=2591382 RepID=UPI002A95EEDB|nr:LacI family DNA-binding transcriptional regulator [Dysosmobacter sp.]MDY5612889.1 LacI family DNA-binding transcriptional regulator [Dysosmobacter sp.]